MWLATKCTARAQESSLCIRTLESQTNGAKPQVKVTFPGWSIEKGPRDEWSAKKRLSNFRGPWRLHWLASFFHKLPDPTTSSTEVSRCIKSWNESRFIPNRVALSAVAILFSHVIGSWQDDYQRVMTEHFMPEHHIFEGFCRVLYGCKSDVIDMAES